MVHFSYEANKNYYNNARSVEQFEHTLQS